MIKWNDVRQDFSGIEIKNFKKLKSCRVLLQKKLKLKEINELFVSWIEAFDMDCGCAWNPKAIIKFKLISNFMCDNVTNN